MDLSCNLSAPCRMQHKSQPKPKSAQAVCKPAQNDNSRTHTHLFRLQLLTPTTSSTSARRIRQIIPRHDIDQKVKLV